MEQVSFPIFLGLQVSCANIVFTLFSPISILIDKDRSQAEKQLCFLSVVHTLPTLPSATNAWALHLLSFQTERKACFVNLDISCTSLLSWVSKLPYTIPNICLQMERMYLRYEQTNEFNQPWKYNRECSVTQSTGMVWGFVSSTCTVWADCIS